MSERNFQTEYSEIAVGLRNALETGDCWLAGKTREDIHDLMFDAGAERVSVRRDLQLEYDGMVLELKNPGQPPEYMGECILDLLSDAKAAAVAIRRDFNVEYRGALRAHGRVQRSRVQGQAELVKACEEALGDILKDAGLAGVVLDRDLEAERSAPDSKALKEK